VFKVKIHEIKTKELPALDDEFAKDVDEEVETLDQLKEKLEKNLKESKEHQAKHATEDAVVEKAAENAEIDIPEAMIDTELNRMMQEFEQRLQMQGLNLDLYFQFSGQDEQALRDQMKEDAQKRVRMNLTLEAIAEAEKIEVGEDEVEAELTKMAEAYNMSAAEIKKALGNLDGVKGDLKVRKAVEFLVQNSKTVA
jgi:trigger factor